MESKNKTVKVVQQSRIFFSQDYDSIIQLVETLNNLPMCQVVGHQNIKFQYIFALNRYCSGSY